MTKIRRFLGLADYYRRFVERFSALALPLTRLLKKEEKFVWIDKYERNFQELKQKLTTAHVLTIPSDPGGYKIYSDASFRGYIKTVFFVLGLRVKCTWDEEKAMVGFDLLIN